MSTADELERRVADWMEHRPERMPDEVVDAVVHAVEQVPQRRAWAPAMQPVAFRLALVAALAGALLLGGLVAGSLINRPALVAEPTLTVAFVAQPAALSFPGLDDPIETGLAAAVGSSIASFDTVVPDVDEAPAVVIARAAATHDVVVVSLTDASAARADAVRATAVARPDVTFIVFGDAEIAGPNVAVVQWRREEGGYLAGILAAGLAPDAPPGFLGGDASSAGVDAFESGYGAGVGAGQGSVAVASERVAFNDAPGANAAMQRLLDGGSSVVFEAAGPIAVGAIPVATAGGAVVIAADEDLSAEAPSTVIGSVVLRSDVVVRRLLDARERSSLGAGIYEFGVGDGVIELVVNPALASRVPPAVRARLDEAVDGFKSGNLSVEIQP